MSDETFSKGPFPLKMKKGDMRSALVVTLNKIPKEDQNHTLQVNKISKSSLTSSTPSDTINVTE